MTILHRTWTYVVAATLLALSCCCNVIAKDAANETVEIRIGIIGLDTSHVIRFTELFNAEDPLEDLVGCRVAAAYPKGSEDIESSVSRVPKYTQQVQDMGVEVVSSIEELLPRVDAVLLESNDGRVHLRQALPVLKAGKRMFIDKPMAASLTDVIGLFEAARHFDTPIFSASSLRYGEGTLAVHRGKVGPVLGCDVYGPCSLEPTHPDLFWYGIHGVEALVTVMGTGCQSISRTHADDADFVVGQWEGGRIGTYRGMRTGTRQFGGIAFGTSANHPVGAYVGYEPLVIDIARFFRTGQSPVSEAETIEIFAIMEAADASKRQGGTPVSTAELIDRAREEARRQQTW